MLSATTIDTSMDVIRHRTSRRSIYPVTTLKGNVKAKDKLGSQSSFHRNRTNDCKSIAKALTPAKTKGHLGTTAIPSLKYSPNSHDME